MATEVYKVEEAVLDDGSTITLKPANIKVMRKGQELMSQLGDGIQDEEESMHKLFDIVSLCLKRERPEFEVEIEEKEETDGETRTVKKRQTNYDLMEELFNMPLIFRVIKDYLGIDLADPKLLEAAMKIAEEQEKAKDGANST